MELTHRFTVPASLQDTWAAFNDLERIAPCFPGAALSSCDGDDFTGLVKVKLGPISLQYTGTGRFVERDQSTGRAVIEAKGKDKRGNGTAAAQITARLSSAGSASTDVEVQTDLNITGKPAQFGRGVMQDVSDKLLAQFATCLESKLAPAEQASAEPVPAEPVPAESSTSTSEAALAAGPAAAAADSEPTGADESAESEAKHRAARASTAAASPTSEATKASGAAANDSGASGPVDAAADGAAPHADTSPPEPPPAELDLGATVLPVLVKRYAPYLIAALLGLVILRRMVGRR